jgi:hypothetical protein
MMEVYIGQHIRNNDLAVIIDMFILNTFIMPVNISLATSSVMETCFYQRIQLH